MANKIISEAETVMMRKIMPDMGFGFEGIGCLEVIAITNLRFLTHLGQRNFKKVENF